MSLRFDWYPNYQHEVIISKSDLIVDRLITKGMAQKTKADLKRTTQREFHQVAKLHLAHWRTLALTLGGVEQLAQKHLPVLWT